MAAYAYKRKHTVIFCADVAGYSGLMGEDEAATVQTLEAYKKVMFSMIEQHRGRVVDSPGDNLLAEFASVVDAVQSGAAIQNELHSRTAFDQSEMKLPLGYEFLGEQEVKNIARPVGGTI